MNVERFDSSNTSVSKFVFDYEDKPAVAEAVLYKYPSYQERTVVCCSSQSGCPVGCTFCGTGEAFVRSFNASEIIAQVDHVLDPQIIGMDAREIESLQIMFMSMGEPLLNKRGMIDALRILHVKYPNAALLISTSAPDIDYSWVREISVEIPKVGLQFSVHESTDEARGKLIPFKRKLTLAQMAKEGEEWLKATGRQPFFNYCVHEGNKSLGDALRLKALFNPDVWQATLSVICEKDEGVSDAMERQREVVEEFQTLMIAAGYSTRLFDPAGQDDIGGGCGQLWYVQKWLKEHGLSNGPN